MINIIAKSTRRNDAVSSQRVRVSAFRKPPFDPWPRLRICFSRCVTNRLLELTVLPLLPVPQHSRLPIRRRELRRHRHRHRRHLAVAAVRCLRHCVPVRHDSNLHRRRRYLKKITRTNKFRLSVDRFRKNKKENK